MFYRLIPEVSISIYLIKKKTIPQENNVKNSLKQIRARAKFYVQIRENRKIREIHVVVTALEPRLEP